MVHCSACSIFLIHMQMDISGCAHNSNGGKKSTINLQLKAAVEEAAMTAAEAMAAAAPMAAATVLTSVAVNNSIDNLDRNGNGDKG